MPTSSSSPIPFPAGRLLVLGTHSTSEKDFVYHVAIACPAERSGEHFVLEMGYGGLKGGTRTLDPAEWDVCGWFEGDIDRNHYSWFVSKFDFLTTRSSQSQHRGRFRFQPPYGSLTGDGVNGCPSRLTFSCVGLVLYCYENGLLPRLNLLRWREPDPDLPPIDRKLMRKVYGIVERDDRELERFGLPPSGPWRPALPGHLLHSLRRPPPDVLRGPVTNLDRTHAYLSSRAT